jgi:hypothetical protein
MGRSGEKFIEETGGFRIDEPMSFEPSHGERIRGETGFGTLSVDEVERIHQMICNLKGLPTDEWNYQAPEDD